MSFIKNHVVYFFRLIEQMTCNICFNWVKIRERLAWSYIGTKVRFDIVLHLSVCLIEVVNIVDERTLVGICIDRELSYRVVLSY